MDEFERRFKAAKQERAGRVEDDGYEVYKYCFNGREDEWLGKYGKNREPEEIFADMVADVAEDFYGDLFNTMTPENQDWVEYETGTAIPKEAEGQVADLMNERAAKIDRAIKASNYYDEGPTAFQDAVFGTVALWVERYHLNQPIVCEAVPSSELYLRLSPFGIDDRFREVKYAYTDLEALFPNAKWSKKLQDKIKAAKGSATVVWGFWHDYTDPGNPIWLQRIRVDKEEIGLDEVLGEEGSMPLLVGRYNAVPRSPWGRGPARRMLPTLRTLDSLVEMNLESMDHTLDPSIIYPHDGMLDLSEGLESGIGYPAMPGTAESIREIGGGNLDYGFFTEERIEERIRNGFYRDMQQRGKTPPSASQYMGEEQKTVRRMARPAGKLWSELGVSLVKRVEYIEVQPGGSLVDSPFLMLDENKVILRPISPLERAQAREEVITAQGIMATAQESLGPEQAGLVIDGPKTMNNIKKVLKDKVVEFRSEDQIREIMQMAQAQQQPMGDPNAQQG